MVHSHRRVVTSLAISLAVLSIGLIGGCQDIDQPNVVDAGVEVGAGAVQATLTADAAPVGPWPDKVGSFSVSFKGGAWWPSELPAGYKIESVDVVEFEPKAGLVCDVVLTKGEEVIAFTQGSPVMRDYEVVPVAKTPWGSEQADVMHEDPSDTTTPRMIVFVGEGTLCELSGSDFEALAAMAASMVPVE